jgi:hypothetical protein
MLTVEDLLDGLYELASNCIERDAWKTNFIYNVYSSVNTSPGRALSTAQANVILKLARQHTSNLANRQKWKVADIQAAISRPQYKTPPVQSQNIPREVRYLGGNKLAFRFKMDETVTRELKALRNSHPSEKAFFNRKYRVWVVTVSPVNLEAVQGIIARHKFAYEQATLEFFMRMTNGKDALPSIRYNNDTGNLVFTIPNNPVLAQLVEVCMGGITQ